MAAVRPARQKGVVRGDEVQNAFMYNASECGARRTCIGGDMIDSVSIRLGYTAG